MGRGRERGEGGDSRDVPGDLVEGPTRFSGDDVGRVPYRVRHPPGYLQDPSVWVAGRGAVRADSGDPLSFL